MSKTNQQSRKSAAAHTRRRFVVFASLVLVLTLTSALLLALAPAPLTPDASASLFAVDAPDAMDVIFQTRVPCDTTPARWRYVYVHHSRTPAGSATTLSQAMPTRELGDHFVIGNGDGAADGEIQVGQRWDNQAPALPPPGAARINADCISICLIGDFDKNKPTAAQMRRLEQLVNALQARFHIVANDVSLLTSITAGKQQKNVSSAAAIGKHFPASEFRGQLLP